MVVGHQDEDHDGRGEYPGEAISVERFLLTLEGDYVREGFAVRGRDFRAVDTINPFPLRLTWEQLDDGL